MNNYDDIEKILTRIAKENPEEMDNIDDIDESVFSRIEAKVLSKEMTGTAKKAKYTFLKVAAAIVAVAAAFSVTLYFADMPNTRAATDSSQQTEEAYGQAVMSSVSLPQYVPEGYNMEYMNFGESDSTYTTEYKYTDSSDSDNYFIVRIEGDSFDISNEYEKSISVDEINGMPLIITNVKSDPELYYADFSDMNGYTVQIVATIDYDTLIKIIESMS